jgi:hypothetical protein
MNPFFDKDEDDYTDKDDYYIDKNKDDYYIENPSFPELSPAGKAKYYHTNTFIYMYINMHIYLHIYVYVYVCIYRYVVIFTNT